MQVHVVRPGELTPEQIALWRRFQAQDPDLANPYFCPDFTLAVGAVRRDAFVGVMEDGGEVVGFFPHQRRPFGVGKPIGGPLSDYQGVIAATGVAWDAAALIRRCGLVAYDFDHMLGAQAAFAPYAVERTVSPYIDLAAGYDAYAEGRKQAKSKVVPDTGRKVRKLEREVGPVRFEIHEPSAAAFAALTLWKRVQYRSTGAYDVFRHGWTVRLLERLSATQNADFAGTFSTLYAGEKLISVHLGMRSRTVWHHWFPAFDRDFYRYSPGLIVVLEMAKAAASLGLSAIDMGWGDIEYKQRLCDRAVPIAIGRVERASAAVGLRRVRRATEALFQSLPLGPVSAVPSKAFYRIERRWNFI